jgi:hypothetical protein
MIYKDAYHLFITLKRIIRSIRQKTTQLLNEKLILSRPSYKDKSHLFITLKHINNQILDSEELEAQLLGRSEQQQIPLEEVAKLENHYPSFRPMALRPRLHIGCFF